MASLNITSVGQIAFQWYISGLSNYWDDDYYLEAKIEVNGSTVDSIYPPTSGTSYTTSWGTASGFTAGQTYTVYAYVKALNGTWYSAGSSSVTMDSPPSPPSGTPSVSATALTNKRISASWTSVSGATGYHVYVNDNAGSGDVWKTNTTSLSATVSIDKEYWNYTVKVIPYNDAGNGSSGSANCTTKDETNPTVSITGSSATATSIALNASGTDTAPTSGNASGISGYWWYKWDGSQWAYQGSSTTGSYTFTGLDPLTSYQVGVRSYDGYNNSSSMATTIVTTSDPRPTNFAWTTAKTSGQSFNLTAAEWNSFTSKINEFRVYKGLSTYGFTSASVGNDFTAVIFNQAVNAINAMSPPTSPPGTKSSGQDIYASYLNDLVSSLNSVP